MLWLVTLLMLMITVVVVAVGYGIYAWSPEGRWHRRVVRAEKQLQALRLAENERLERVKQRWQATVFQLCSEAAEWHLAGCDVQMLDRFPGIGPKTVEQLRQAGLNDLAAVYRARDRLPVALRSRMGLVQAAIAQLYDEAQRRFRQHPGQLPEHLQRKYALQEAHYQRELEHIEARLRILSESQEELSKLRRQYLGQASFWALARRWWRKQPTALPDPVLNHPILNVEAYLLERERRARVPKETQIGPLPQDTRRPGPVSQEPSTSGVGTTGLRGERRATPAPKPASPPDLVDLEIRILYLLARADGRLSQQERDWIIAYCQREFARDMNSANRVRLLCASYENASLSLEDILALLQQTASHPRWPTAWPAWLELVQLAQHANPRKRELCQRIAQVLQLPLPEFFEKDCRVGGTTSAPPDGKPQLAAGAPDIAGRTLEAQDTPLSLEQARELLRLPSEGLLQPDQIRRQYESLLPLYDPEKERVKGAEFVALAECKRGQIRQAAVLLLRQAGVENPERYLDEPLQPEADVSRYNPDLDQILGM
ncbi:MAG: TerB family tellurite resistance protein [Gemmatales bacterium]|nr:TerB family tellurite resistance protein [Gemmatales bacterium]